MTALKKSIKEALAPKPSGLEQLTTSLKSQIGDLQKQVNDQQTTFSGEMQAVRASHATELSELRSSSAQQLKSSEKKAESRLINALREQADKLKDESSQEIEQVKSKFSF